MTSVLFKSKLFAESRREGPRGLVALHCPQRLASVVSVKGVFVLVKGVFVLVKGVFVLVHGVFVLVHGVLGLRSSFLGLRLSNTRLYSGGPVQHFLDQQNV